MYDGSPDREMKHQNSQMPNTTHGQLLSGGFYTPGSPPQQVDHDAATQQYTVNQGYPPAQTGISQPQQGYYPPSQAGGLLSQQGYYPSTQAGGSPSQPGGLLSQQGSYAPAQAGQFPQQGYAPPAQTSSGQLSQRGYYAPTSQAGGQGAYQSFANQGFAAPPQSPNFVYQGPSRGGLMPSRKSGGGFSSLDRSTKIGLVSGIAVLLAVIIIGLSIITSMNGPAKQAAQTTSTTPTMDTSTPTPTPITPTPTVAPTPTPVPTATLVPTAAPAALTTLNPTPTPRIVPTPTMAPTPPPSPTPTATTVAAANCPPVPSNHTNDVEPTPPNPWCYDFDQYATVANLITNPPANFCAVMTLKMSNGNFRCNAHWAQQTGFVGLCTDDSWARSPHRATVDDACKDDGGWEQDLYQHV